MKKKVSDYISMESREVPRSLKLPRRWVLMIGEKNSFSLLFSRSFSSGELVVLLAGVFMVCLFLAGAIICVTPLKSVLPGYLGRTERGMLVDLRQRVDSLQDVCSSRNIYMENLYGILSGNPAEENTAAPDTVDTRFPVDSLLPASAAERKFIAEFEERERHNQSVLVPIAAGGMLFQKPVRTVSEISQTNGKGIIVKTVAGTAVDAAYRGTVVDIHYSDKRGCVTIQHPNGFLSVYSGLGSVYVTDGEKIRSGSRIGTVAHDNPALCIHMWHNGSEISPKEILGY